MRLVCKRLLQEGEHIALSVAKPGTFAKTLYLTYVCENSAAQALHT